MQTRFIAFLLFLGLATQAQQRPYVVDSSNKIRKGISITADATGKVRLETESGVFQTLKPGQFKYAWGPAPSSLKQAQAAMNKKDWKAALPILEKAFDSHKHLGWAAWIARARVKCHLGLNDTDAAMRAAKEGYSSEKKPSRRDQMTIIQAEILVAEGDFAKAEKAISRVKATLEDQETSTTLINVRAKLLAAKGNKKEAVLEYLKTVLVFRPGTDNHREALDEVIALLQELKDNRHQDFAAMRKQQYGS